MSGFRPNRSKKISTKENPRPIAAPMTAWPAIASMRDTSIDVECLRLRMCAVSSAKETKHEDQHDRAGEAREEDPASGRRVQNDDATAGLLCRIWLLLRWRGFCRTFSDHWLAVFRLAFERNAEGCRGFLESSGGDGRRAGKHQQPVSEPGSRRQVAGDCARKLKEPASTNEKIRHYRGYCRCADCRRRSVWFCDRMAAGDCGDRAAGEEIFRSGDDQARSRARGTWQLQRLPYRARWQGFCRRTSGADAVRHDLLDQYHSGSGNRHPPLVGGGIPPRHALGRRS